MTRSLEAWLEAQWRHSIPAMLRSVSPVGIVKARPGFGQVVQPVRGAIVASPVPASYDPEPDYFFHWYRDSAVVIDALRLLFEQGALREEAPAHLADFTRFSLSLAKLDGRDLVADRQWRQRVTEGFLQFVRDDDDLARVHGDGVPADTRVNPDGTIDISRWPRPQHDGPALRALALLRWMKHVERDSALALEMAQLVKADLAFALARWDVPCYDIWEEELGHHYYTLNVTAAALSEGASWLLDMGDAGQARACENTARAIRRRLDEFWLPEAGHYRSRFLADGTRSTKELDIAPILAAIHSAPEVPAVGDSPAHTPGDPRLHSTLARLEQLFEAAYPINQQRPEERGVAMGRYAGDVYYSGGAYYFSTLGAAELCFRAAVWATESAARDEQRGMLRTESETPGEQPGTQRPAKSTVHGETRPGQPSAGSASDWIRRGNAWLETVRAFTPESGDLSEQFDQRTGEPASARHLAWSYAAFISCVLARKTAMRLRR